MVGAAILFLILQRRYVRKQREEDANDRHRSLDFGLGEVPLSATKKKKKRGIAGLSLSGEKSRSAHNHLSMDMSLSSPYLLPPELHESRESFHSLSRTIHNKEDPYRPIAQLHDAASVRSFPKGVDAGSTYTSSSKAYSHVPSKFQDNATADLTDSAKMSRSASPINTFVHPPRDKSLPARSLNPFTNASELKPEEAPAPPYPAELPRAHVPMPSISRQGLPASPLPTEGHAQPPDGGYNEAESNAASSNASQINDNNYLGSFINAEDLDRAADKGAGGEVPSIIKRKSPPVGLPANPRPAHTQSAGSIQMPDQPVIEEDYGESFKITPPSPTFENQHAPEHRYSMDVPPEEFAHAGLGAPGFDPRRLSMGFRPLPPNAINEVDDPEIRANRIRSFYKEYFDESKPAPEGQYYEDYDENYLGDTGYYDTDQNNFVMPYAQPVTRRAMTPPPRGPRFQGSRIMHGSLGGMSMNGMGMGGMRGRPGQRAYSSASGRIPGPRAFSSASGRMGPPRRPMPPPVALPTLPTPSKLRDDNFAIFNAADFAPPTSYRDRVSGRSDSPLGGRRPYSPAVPSFIPTVSAFDELPSMPSP